MLVVIKLSVEANSTPPPSVVAPRSRRNIEYPFGKISAVFTLESSHVSVAQKKSGLFCLKGKSGADLT